ncbi:hypothetical protein, partial [Salmonella enterica]
MPSGGRSVIFPPPPPSRRCVR